MTCQLVDDPDGCWAVQNRQPSIAENRIIILWSQVAPALPWMSARFAAAGNISDKKGDCVVALCPPSD